jgi:hypothetical protein
MQLFDLFLTIPIELYTLHAWPHTSNTVEKGQKRLEMCSSDTLKAKSISFLPLFLLRQ